MEKELFEKKLAKLLERRRFADFRDPKKEKKKLEELKILAAADEKKLKLIEEENKSQEPTITLKGSQEHWCTSVGKGHVQSNIDVHKINDGVQESQTDKLLDIKDLATVLQELTSSQKFDYATKWKQLGLYLGLYQPTLKAIEVNCRGQVWDCLMDCLSSWLKGEDGARETRGGRSNWISLVAALDAMGEREVANDIRMKYLK